MKPSWIHTAIAGFSTAILIALLSLERTIALNIALVCLSISLPFIAVAAFLPSGASHSIDQHRRNNAAGCLTAIGILFSAISYACVFFHFNMVIGIAFVVSSVVAFGRFLTMRK
jgi:hypothetical protein